MKALITLIASLVLFTACIFDEPVQVKAENVVKVDTLVIDTNANNSRCQKYWTLEGNLTTVYDFDSVCVFKASKSNKPITIVEATKELCPYGSKFITGKEIDYLATIFYRKNTTPENLEFLKNNVLASTFVSKNPASSQVVILKNGVNMWASTDSVYSFHCVQSFLK